MRRPKILLRSRSTKLLHTRRERSRTYGVKTRIRRPKTTTSGFAEPEVVLCGLFPPRGWIGGRCGADLYSFPPVRKYFRFCKPTFGTKTQSPNQLNQKSLLPS